jgi:pimeloyl-ACP methyl ester carboxylesterase
LDGSLTSGVRTATLRRPDGTTIAYDVAGDGPPVAFVHGITNRRQAWEPVTALLAGGVTCVRMDLRGHGESSAAPEYSMLSLVGDVRAVLEELGLDDPVVVGHSLGGTVGAIYAAAHDARAVVCVDQSLRFGDFAAVVQPHADALRGERTMEIVMEIERGLKLEPYPRLEDMERRVLAFPREVVLGIWDTLLTTPSAQLTATAESFLPRITAPLLSLHGSPPLPDYEAWLTSLVPSARVEVWDGCGHMLHLVDPERFATRVRSLLADPPAT